MSVIATALKHLIAAGVSGDDLVRAVADMEAEVRAEPKPRSAGAIRQERYRERYDITPAEWAVIRLEIFERDGYACTYCGETEDLACDHVIPLVQGGTSHPENLTTACKACNSEKSGRTPIQWLGEAN